MPKFKHDVKVGDIIHIYHMFGYPEYKEAEGVVTDYTDTGVFGTWGPDGLNYDDDWEILEEKEEPGWYEFEPGKFIWDEMEANP